MAASIYRPFSGKALGSFTLPPFIEVENFDFNSSHSALSSSITYPGGKLFRIILYRFINAFCLNSIYRGNISIQQYTLASEFNYAIHQVFKFHKIIHDSPFISWSFCIIEIIGERITQGAPGWLPGEKQGQHLFFFRKRSTKNRRCPYLYLYGRSGLPGGRCRPRPGRSRTGPR